MMSHTADAHHTRDGAAPERGLPGDLTALRRELARNARAMLGNMLAGAGLAPRDEFLVQAELLSRLAERVEELERRVAALEQRPPA